MTSVAANIVTNGPSGAGSIGSGASSTPAGDDGFAAILGGVMQPPPNDATKASSPAKPSDAQSDSTSEATSDPATDCSARANQMPLLLQEAAQDAASDPNAAIVSLPRGGDTTTDPAGALRGGNAGRLAKGFQSDPAKVASGDAAPAKPVNASTDSNATDPVLAQLLAAQQALPNVAPTPAAATTPAAPDTSRSPGVDSDPAKLAVEALAAPATDATAASMLTGGATAPKGGRPGATEDKPTADSEKAQTQGSTAAVLAQTAASRSFTDEKVSSAHALPLHIATDTPRNNSQSGGSPSEQQNSSNNTATPAPAADTPAAPANFAPAHAAAAPQPDASAAINTAAATAPTAAVAASTPTQAATQLQISHPATATQPDLNALAFNIATKSEAGARHFDIRMDPAELGRVDVRLTVDDAGKAQAQLSVEKPQTLELLQKDQGHLERALKDAGLDLSQNGLSFSLKGQQQQTGDSGGNASSSRGRALAVRAIAAADTAATNLSLGSVGASDTRLDIRV